MQKEYNRPDEAAMRRVLERVKGELGEIILRLAWNLGLTREEIRQLKWSEVSFSDNQVVLSDRSIPMDDETAECLKLRAHSRGHVSEYVVNGDRNRLQLQAPSISRIVRQALGQEESLKDISLRDLRHDFIIRQLAEHDWPYVARISGMAATSMYNLFSDYMVEQPYPEKAPEKPSEPDEFLIWKIVQSEGTSPEGLALWMAWKHIMEVNEIIALTWDDVDFNAGTIKVADREIVMDAMLRRRLQTVLDGRAPGDDPHVLLTPRSRRPYDHSRLSYATRTVFIRNGVENWTMNHIILAAKRNIADSAVLQLIADRGSITRKDVMELFGVSSVSAYERLRRLVEAGKVVRVGAKYYIAGKVVPPEEHYEKIRDYLEMNGGAYRQDLADLLRIEGRPCSAILRRFVEEGKVVRTGQIYTLPPKKV